MVRVRQTRLARVAQGDIIRNVEYVEHVIEKSGYLDISRIRFPFVVVLTQDCDLEQDYRSRSLKNKSSTSDKHLLSVLVAPLYNLEHIYSGEHLSQLGQTMQKIERKRTSGGNLRNNETPRYHHLDFEPTVQLPPSVIDFKHYFSVNVSQLKKHKKKEFICQLADLYREDVSQRFSSFLARIGLP